MMLTIKGCNGGLFLDSRTFQDPGISSEKMSMEYEGGNRCGKRTIGQGWNPGLFIQCEAILHMESNRFRS